MIPDSQIKQVSQGRRKLFEIISYWLTAFDFLKYKYHLPPEAMQIQFLVKVSQVAYIF